MSVTANRAYGKIASRNTMVDRQWTLATWAVGWERLHEWSWDHDRRLSPPPFGLHQSSHQPPIHQPTQCRTDSSARTPGSTGSVTSTLPHCCSLSLTRSCFGSGLGTMVGDSARQHFACIHPHTRHPSIDPPNAAPIRARAQLAAPGASPRPFHVVAA